MQNEHNQQLQTLEDNIQSPDKSRKKIILRTFENIHLVNINDIVYCQSHDNYTNFHLLNGKQILVSNTLKDFDEMLSEYGFFRAHKSYLVNLLHIDRFEKAEGGTIILTDESRVPVATRKKEQLLDMLNQLSGI
jgi:two-component system LytT family response regulator